MPRDNTGDARCLFLCTPHICTYANANPLSPRCGMTYRTNARALNTIHKCTTQLSGAPVQAHTISQFAHASQLKARASCALSWRTRAAHPDPHPMPPPTLKQQKLQMRVLLEYWRRRLSSSGFSSDGCRSLCRRRVPSISEPGQPSVGTGSARASGARRLKVPAYALIKIDAVTLLAASKFCTPHHRSCL